MARRMSFAQGEWYHCYNRGVEKRTIYEGEDDANRFLMLLYLANNDQPVDLFTIEKPSLPRIFTSERGAAIVSVGAYCLMPNHYHLLVKEISDGGITSFMRKVGTAYTMFFNAKYGRTGHLFSGPFKSRHVGTDRYFQRVLQYIHCNPAEVFEPGWKTGKVRDMRGLGKRLVEYPYSSFATHERVKSDPIIAGDVFDVARRTPLPRMLEESREYYADMAENL